MKNFKIIFLSFKNCVRDLEKCEGRFVILFVIFKLEKYGCFNSLVLDWKFFRVDFKLGYK